MRTRTALGGSLSAVALVAATSLGAGALTGTFTEVEPAEPDGLVFGSDINDAGQSTGSADFPGGVSAFLRDADGTYTQLVPLPGDAGSYGIALNDGGDVVGGSDGIATLWEAGGAPVDLGTLAGDTGSQAYDINNDGWIVGTSTGADPSQSWYRDPDAGTLVDLGNVTGGTNVQVRAINDAGVAVGRVLVDGEWAPFTWNVDDGMSLMPLPPGEVEFEAAAINSLGQVVGFTFEFIAPEGFYRAYLWDPIDGYTELTMDGYASAFATGLNDDGLVVGFVENPDAERGPAAWHTGVGDATAFPHFSEAAFTNEFNAVNSSGIAIGISREGDDLERTYIGPIGIESAPAEPVAPTAPPAQPAPVAPTFTG